MGGVSVCGCVLHPGAGGVLQGAAGTLQKDQDALQDTVTRQQEEAGHEARRQDAG